ncbi:MAG: hypothetical protein KKH72_04300 [Alphaproteobacteria bacterium]|nr:hypothetical protein [Alphaproteobacteria bacterium]
MLIKRDVLERIRSGEITLQFRRWRRRTVRENGTLKTKLGIITIGSITPVSADQVTDEDAARAGLGDRAGFHCWLATMKPGELDRIEVGWLGDAEDEAQPVHTRAVSPPST